MIMIINSNNNNINNDNTYNNDNDNDNDDDNNNDDDDSLNNNVIIGLRGEVRHRGGAPPVRGPRGGGLARAGGGVAADLNVKHEPN